MEPLVVGGKFYYSTRILKKKSKGKKLEKKVKWRSRGQVIQKLKNLFVLQRKEILIYRS